MKYIFSFENNATFNPLPSASTIQCSYLFKMPTLYITVNIR